MLDGRYRKLLTDCNLDSMGGFGQRMSQDANLFYLATRFCVLKWSRLLVYVLSSGVNSVCFLSCFYGVNLWRSCLTSVLKISNHGYVSLDRQNTVHRHWTFNNSRHSGVFFCGDMRREYLIPVRWLRHGAVSRGRHNRYIDSVVLQREERRIRTYIERDLICRKKDTWRPGMNRSLQQ